MPHHGPDHSLGCAARRPGLGTAELGADSRGVMLPLDPGAHRAVVTAPGPGAQAFSLRLAEGQKLEIEVAPGPPLAPRPASEPDQETGLASFWLRHRASLLVGGGAVVLAAVGAGPGAATWSSSVDLGGSCVGTPAGCAEDDIDAVESQAVATNVLFGAAGVAAATAAVLFIFVEGSPPPADARAAAVRRAIALAPAPGGVALGVRY
ncbi:MAG: hypothetical protein HY744_14915 [Deltaproteobacteria bacterium]|nr:hypothetical protein [Deltaproteobacteria bacterium]